MNDDILVTVFMPMYNSENYIKEAINSILNQSYKNIELLIIDDGSTDNSVNIVKSYSDKRIRLIHNDYNRGLPYTRNKGLEKAKGDYIALMDSDDISHPHRIFKQVKFMNENRNIDVIGSNMIMFKFDNSNLVKWDNVDMDNHYYINSERTKILMMFHDPIPNSSAMIRKTSIIENSIKYNEKFFVAQDYEFFSRISQKCNICILNDKLLAYRTGHENITKLSKKNKLQERRKLLFDITSSIFEYYKFNIDEKKMSLFKLFFGEELLIKIEKNTVHQIRTLINNIIIDNKKNKNFDQDVFIDVINSRVLLSIRRSKISLGKKILYYKILSTNNKYFNYFNDVKLITNDKIKYYKKYLQNIRWNI